MFRTSDHIQGGQNGPKLSGMVRSDTRSGSRSEKFFEALMPKVSNHENAVSCHLSLVNFATTQAIQTLLESDEDLFRIFLTGHAPEEVRSFPGRFLVPDFFPVLPRQDTSAPGGLYRAFRTFHN